jgi:hypothetical protein
MKSEGQMLKWLRRNLKYLFTLIFLSLLAFILIFYSTHGFMGDESPLALNLGADFVGVVVTYIIFNLILDKIEEARIKEYDRFDLKRFVRDMSDVTDEVRILSTWTDLLKSDSIKPKFFDATLRLIKRGPTVKILLLDPYSIAAAQREKEIGLAARQRGEAPDERDSVQSVIRRNLRDLDAFRAALPDDERDRLQVRIYDATPAIRLLTQDDTGYVAFFPRGIPSTQGRHLAINMNTSLGQFCRDKFDELWDTDLTPTITLRTYMRLPLAFTTDDAAEHEHSAQYVKTDGRVYVALTDLPHAVIATGVERCVVSAPLKGETAAYRAKALHTGDADYDDIHARFREKYGDDASAVYQLLRVENADQSLSA